MTWLDDVRARTPMPRLVDLPPRYAGAKLSLMPDGPVRQTVVRYVQDFETLAEQGLAPVFLGRAQQYKSFGAALIAQEAHAMHGLDTYWFPARRIATEEFDDLKRLLRHLEQAPFVVVDDFHVLNTAYQRQMLESVVAARFDALRPTLFTGNIPVNPKDYWAPIETEWGPTFTRRIKEGGRGYTVFIA